MFSLLRLPNFPEPLVTGFALANLPDLRVKIFEPFSFCIGRNFDGPFFWHERDLIVSVLVRGAVEYGTDSFTHRHIVCAPIGIEQNPIAVFSGAIRE